MATHYTGLYLAVILLFFYPVILAAPLACHSGATVASSYEACTCKPYYYGQRCENYFKIDVAELLDDSPTLDGSALSLIFPTPEPDQIDDSSIVLIPTHLAIAPDRFVIGQNAAKYILTWDQVCPSTTVPIEDELLSQYYIGISNTLVTTSRTDEFGILSNLPTIYALSPAVTIRCHTYPRKINWLQDKYLQNILPLTNVPASLRQPIPQCYISGLSRSVANFNTVNKLSSCICAENYIGNTCGVEFVYVPFLSNTPPLFAGNKFKISLYYKDPNASEFSSPGSFSILSQTAVCDTTNCIKPNILTFDTTSLNVAYSNGAVIRDILYYTPTGGTMTLLTYVPITALVPLQYVVSITATPYSPFSTAFGFTPCDLDGTDPAQFSLSTWSTQTVGTTPIQYCKCNSEWYGPFCNYHLPSAGIPSSTNTLPSVKTLTFSSRGESVISDPSFLCTIEYSFTALSKVISRKSTPCFSLRTDGSLKTYDVSILPYIDADLITDLVLVTSFLTECTLNACYIDVGLKFGELLVYPLTSYPYVHSPISNILSICVTANTIASIAASQQCICKPGYFGPSCALTMNINTSDQPSELIRYGMIDGVGSAALKFRTSSPLATPTFSYSTNTGVSTILPSSSQEWLPIGPEYLVTLSLDLSQNLFNLRVATDTTSLTLPLVLSDSIGIFSNQFYNSSLVTTRFLSTIEEKRCSRGIYVSAISACKCPSSTTITYFGSRCQYKLDTSDFPSFYSGQQSFVLFAKFDPAFNNEFYFNSPTSVISPSVTMGTDPSVQLLTTVQAAINNKPTSGDIFLTVPIVLYTASNSFTIPAQSQAKDKILRFDFSFSKVGSPNPFATSSLSVVLDAQNTLNPSITTSSTRFYGCRYSQTSLSQPSLSNLINSQKLAAYVVKYNLLPTSLTLPGPYCGCPAGSFGNWCQWSIALTTQTNGVVIDSNQPTILRQTYNAGYVFKYSTIFADTGYTPRGGDRMTQCELTLRHISSQKSFFLGDCRFKSPTNFARIPLDILSTIPSGSADFSFEVTVDGKVFKPYPNTIFTVVTPSTTDPLMTKCYNAGPDTPASTPASNDDACSCTNGYFGFRCEYQLTRTDVLDLNNVSSLLGFSQVVASIRDKYLYRGESGIALSMSGFMSSTTYSPPRLTYFSPELAQAVLFSQTFAETTDPKVFVLNPLNDNFLTQLLMGPSMMMLSSSSGSANLHPTLLHSMLSPRDYIDKIISVFNAQGLIYNQLRNCHPTGTVAYNIAQFLKTPLNNGSIGSNTSFCTCASGYSGLFCELLDISLAPDGTVYPYDHQPFQATAFLAPGFTMDRLGFVWSDNNGAEITSPVSSTTTTNSQYTTITATNSLWATNPYTDVSFRLAINGYLFPNRYFICSTRDASGQCLNLRISPSMNQLMPYLKDSVKNALSSSFTFSQAPFYPGGIFQLTGLNGATYTQIQFTSQVTGVVFRADIYTDGTFIFPNAVPSEIASYTISVTFAGSPIAITTADGPMTVTLDPCSFMRSIGFCQLTEDHHILSCDPQALALALKNAEPKTPMDITTPWCQCQNGYSGESCQIPDNAYDGLWSTEGAKLVHPWGSQSSPFSQQIISDLTLQLAMYHHVVVLLDSNGNSIATLDSNTLTPPAFTTEIAAHKPFLFPLTLQLRAQFPSIEQFTTILSPTLISSRFPGTALLDVNLATNDKPQITRVHVVSDSIIASLAPPQSIQPFNEYYFYLEKVDGTETTQSAIGPALFGQALLVTFGNIITRSSSLPSTIFTTNTNNVVDDKIYDITVHLPPHGELSGYMLKIYVTTPSTPTLTLVHVATIPTIQASCAPTNPDCDSSNPTPFQPSPTNMCPPLMKYNPEHNGCICVTQACARYTYAGMLYLEQNRNPNTNEIIPFKTSLFTTMLPSYLTSYLDLNLISYQLLPQTTSHIGIEAVYLTPMTMTTTDYTALQMYITLTPFFPSTVTNDQITSRFNTIFAQFRDNILLSPMTWLDGTNTYSIPYDGGITIRTLPLKSSLSGVTLATPTNFVAFPINTATPLTTKCRYIEPVSAMISMGKCPAVNQLSSIYWLKTPCPSNPTGQDIASQLFPYCVDLFGDMTITGTKWCTTLYPSYPQPTIVYCPTDKPSLPVTPVLTISSITTSDGTQHTPPPTPATTTELPIINLSETIMLSLFTEHLDLSSTISIFLSGTMYTNKTTPRRLLLNTVAASTTSNIPLTIPTGIKVSTTEQPLTFTALVVQYNNDITLNASFPVTLHDDINLCADNGESCDLQTQTCDRYTGACSCKSSLYEPSPINPTKCVAKCTKPCENGGVCEVVVLGSTTQVMSTQCSCPTPDIFKWDEYCHTTTHCTDNAKQKCGSRGFLQTSLSSIDPEGCESQCSCYNYWVNADRTDMTCSTCSLRSKCHPVGTNPLTWDKNGLCDKCVCNYGYSGELCNIRSMYGTIEFSGNVLSSSGSVSSLQHSTDYIPMTHEEEYDYFMTSNATDNSVQLSDDSRRDLERDLSLSLNIPEGSVSLLRLSRSLTNDTVQVFNTLSSSALTTPLTTLTTPVVNSNPNAITALFLITSTTTISSSSMMLQDSSSTVTDDTTPITDLYQQWLALQQKTQETPGTSPIENSDGATELGAATGVNPAYDPNCVNGTTTSSQNCPAGENPYNSFLDPTDSGNNKKNTTNVIIIAVVVPVGVVLIFVTVALTVSTCKKAKLLCFAPQKDNRNGQKNHLSHNSSRHTHDDAHLGLGDDNDLLVLQSRTKSNGTEMSAMSAATSGKKSASGRTIEKQSITMGMTPVEDDESKSLPSGWRKMRHDTTNDIFYVNDTEMLSQRHLPGTEAPNQYGSNDANW